jgi:hypothetical protein
MFKDVQISKAQPYLETPISCILDVDHDVWVIYSDPIEINQFTSGDWVAHHGQHDEVLVDVNVRNVAGGVDLAREKQFESCRLQSPNWVLVFSLH